ncbi:MAG TPA: gamma-glutamylcyclotransferase [Bauldia sp.]|nr:gamma-glutamylcyclotransferase [Bauldia sp.]
MSDLWVFAYGSLMWRPGFPYAESISAHLSGAHRSLCVYSFVHRGTRERPGLVLGLDRGGSCRGVAYRVEAERGAAGIAYLRERELVTDVYIEALRTIRLDHPGHPRVKALTYLVDRRHEQYAGALPRERILDIVRGAAGRSGVNAEYVANTATRLRDLGFRDGGLDWVADHLGQAGLTPQARDPGP